MSEKIAVFGGSGFIGFHLTNLLKTKKCQVVVYDIVEPENKDEKIAYNYMDIRDTQTDYAFLTGFDYVYILSGLLGKRCSLEPENGFQTNIVGTCHLINCISKLTKKPVVVFTSSAMVYDDLNNDVPLVETASIRAGALYGISKIMGESLLKSCNITYGLKVVILRFFTVYGPGPASAAKGHFVPIWIEQANTREELSVYGDGEQTIDLTHVSSLAKALCKIVEKDKEELDFEVVNIASGTETKVNEIANWFLEIMPNLSLKYLREKKGFPKRKYANLSRAKAFLDFEPNKDLKKEFLDFLKSKLK